MQINRIFQILYILINKKTITAKELSEKLEVSTRTIYRDIEVLSSCNIPIFMTKGKGGGISILEDFVLNKTILSNNEQEQILHGLNLLKLTPNNEDILSDKLSQLFKKDNSQWIDIDFNSWGYEDKKFFPNLKKAIINKKLINFRYHSSSGIMNERVVEPHQLYFKNKSWYLKAFEEEKGFRLFKLNRMKNLLILDIEFSHRNLPKFNEENIPISSLVTVNLWISKELAYRVYDEFLPENITISNEEDFIVSFTYPENQWIYDYILSFGSKCKVLNPPYIKEIICHELEKTLKNYF